MQNVLDAIYVEIDELYDLASKVQHGWQGAIAKRELNRNYNDIKNRESTNYDLRIEFDGINFRIRWFEVRFVRHGSKVTRLRKSITCPANGKHKMSQFKKAQEWELQIIRIIEESMAQIRVKLKHLGKAHSSILWADKVNSNSTVKSRDIKYRVERKERSMKQVKESLM